MDRAAERKRKTSNALAIGAARVGLRWVTPSTSDAPGASLAPNFAPPVGDVVVAVRVARLPVGDRGRRTRYAT
jgi:hypothetical protein